jgi:hypothetical protein
MSRLMRMGRGGARQTAAPGVRRSPPRGGRRAHTSPSFPAGARATSIANRGIIASNRGIIAYQRMV